MGWYRAVSLCNGGSEGNGPLDKTRGEYDLTSAPASYGAATVLRDVGRSQWLTRLSVAHIAGYVRRRRNAQGGAPRIKIALRIQKPVKVKKRYSRDTFTAVQVASEHVRLLSQVSATGLLCLVG